MTEETKSKTEEGSEEELLPTMKKNIGEVLAAVADKIRISGAAVRDRVINSLVEQKLSQRAGHIEKALLKLKDADKELKKLVPDVEQFAEGSDKPQKFFSKDRRTERKKVEEARAKLERALEICLAGKDEKGADATEEHWNKLAECVK